MAMIQAREQPSFHRLPNWRGFYRLPYLAQVRFPHLGDVGTPVPLDIGRQGLGRDCRGL